MTLVSCESFIDGEELVAPELEGEAAEAQTGPRELSIELAKGIHRIELMTVVPQSSGKVADSSVKTKIDVEPYVVPVENAKFFASVKVKNLLKDELVKPINVSYDEASNSHVLDLEGVSSRIVRMWMLDYEGGVPAISKIELNDAAGERVLPTAKGYQELQKNDILEVGPNDKITITYEDGAPYNPNNSLHEAYMSADYYNGNVTPVIAVFEDMADGRTQEKYATLRRFDVGDPIRVSITDFDADISPEMDSVAFKLRASSGHEIELTAPETDANSGNFVGSFFPVSGEPGRDSELRIEPGDDVIITYRDNENTDPGIPWDREAHD